MTCAVQAFFGEDDVVQPSETSARLFEEYLATAGNQDVTIVMLPDVGHNIDWATPGYSDNLSPWSSSHDRSWPCGFVRPTEAGFAVRADRKP